MARIVKWGNSHGVRLPRDVLAAGGIDADAEVAIVAERGRIVISLVRRKPTLADLLAQIRPGDDFSEIDHGAPQGREVL
jgi:antitoxin MazE